MSAAATVAVLSQHRPDHAARAAGSPVLRLRALIILNPTAGRSRTSAPWLGRVVAALERRGCAAAVRRAGQRSGDAARLAREAEAEFDIIVAAGGDGTLNAVVNGMAPASRPVALLPLGTANLLAHEIGLPRDPERMAELTASAPARPVWPGLVGDRLFLTMASSGFDAEIVAAVNPWLKRHGGRLAFAWAILVGLWRYLEYALRVRADGAEHRATTLIATKGRFYAGPHLIAPRADLAEPMLDLVLFQSSGRRAVLRYLAALLLGSLARRRDIVVLRSREAFVSAAEAVPVQANGEIVACLPVRIGVAERPLQLVRPRDRAC